MLHLSYIPRKYWTRYIEPAGRFNPPVHAHGDFHVGKCEGAHYSRSSTMKAGLTIAVPATPWALLNYIFESHARVLRRQHADHECQRGKTSQSHMRHEGYYSGREVHIPSPDAISTEAFAPTALQELSFPFVATLTMMAHSVVCECYPPLY